MSSRLVRPGWPETKISSPSLAPAGAPLQEMLDLGRLAVLVDAEEADVEIVARVLEVVRVAAEEGDVLLRGEDQPHVGVFLVAIEMVQAALVQRDHVAAQAGLVERFFFDRVHHGLPLLAGLGRVDSLLDGRLDSSGDVLDVDQHVQFQVDALDLVLALAGVKAGLDQVLLRRAELLQAIGPDVMVGHHQAVGRDERARAAAVEAHRRLLHVPSHSCRGLEAVLLFEHLRGGLLNSHIPSSAESD